MAFTNFWEGLFTEIYDDDLSPYTTQLAFTQLLKINKVNTRTRCEIFSELRIKTLERLHWRHSGVFIVNFKHI